MIAVDRRETATMNEHEHLWRYTTSMVHPELGPFGACDECGAVDFDVFGPSPSGEDDA